jgi:hypothetical protein
MDMALLVDGGIQRLLATMSHAYNPPTSQSCNVFAETPECSATILLGLAMLATEDFHMRGLCPGGRGPDRLQAKVYKLDA